MSDYISAPAVSVDTIMAAKQLMLSMPKPSVDVVFCTLTAFYKMTEDTEYNGALGSMGGIPIVPYSDYQAVTDWLDNFKDTRGRPANAILLRDEE